MFIARSANESDKLRRSGTNLFSHLCRSYGARGFSGIKFYKHGAPAGAWIKLAVVTALSIACASAAESSVPSLLPLPQKLESHDGSFKLGPATRILTDRASQAAAAVLADRLRPATDYTLNIGPAQSAAAPANTILLTTNQANPALAREGYELTVAAERVVIRAPTDTGVFYGVQTLLQLLPPEIFSATSTNIAWQIPCVQIEDQPRFPWRGMMLDVSRHFFTKAEIKRWLDLLALHKINTFHWHLVDDQGWRIEIKKYPKLTEVGAWRSGVGFGFAHDVTTNYAPDGRYGGFYTQDDIREVVAYAQARHITIIPEIEMPGHSVAALSAYPQFSCNGGPYNTDIGAGVQAGVYCAGKEETFAFLQDVLTEVMDLFPGPFIHIGGDEVPKDNWHKCTNCQARIQAEGLKDEHELQSYFIRRIEKFINAHGRRLIGWSEIREGGLAPSAAVMDWIGGGLEAAKAGHDVVMSPTSFCYFDYYQSRDQRAEPRAGGGFIPLNKVYAFEPIPTGLDPELQPHILGGQGNVWTEYIPHFRQVEYMAFPRLCALSEVLWSPKDSRNWGGFTNRLAVHEQRLDFLEVNYRRESSVKINSQISRPGN